MAQSHIKHTAHLINLRDILCFFFFLGELNLCCRQFVCKFVSHAVTVSLPGAITNCGVCGGCTQLTVDLGQW